MPRISNRRQFLADVGKGTLLATLGPLATEMGLAPAFADDVPEALEFGAMESLVRFMQETPLPALQPALVGKLRAGVPLKRLLAAGALANARSFGGEDYVGFHTLMALAPALHMAQLMPGEQAALPVLKVLYRNTGRIQEHGGRGSEVLRRVPADAVASAPAPTAEALLAAVRGRDAGAAERMFSGMVERDAAEAFAALLGVVQEDTEVHRTVLPYRAWVLLDVVGAEHAATLLRQSLRYCLQAEQYRREQWEEHGSVLTRLLDEHRLLGRVPGSLAAEDGFVEQLGNTIYNATPGQAAGAVAAALAEGFDPAVIGEALSLAANQIVLRDQGRPPAWESPGKPPGSVHGDSVGVHASDSINAWRNLSRASSGRNVYACLILGAWQVARDRASRPELLTAAPLPSSYHLANLKTTGEAGPLLGLLDTAIRENMQAHAVAVVQRCAERNVPAEPVFQLLLRYAVSEDGALHAEKYFETTWDDFHSTRPAFRWRHLMGLARVTASEFGRAAAGQEEARELLQPG